MTEINESTSHPTSEPVDAMATDAPVISPTWEDDESGATFFLRALATLIIGAYLTWAQHEAPVASNSEWLRWIWLSVVANLLFPLGIIWLFFAQGIVHLDWLKEQKSNAWNYGWKFRPARQHLKTAFLLGGVMAIAMMVFRFLPAGREAAAYYKNDYFPPMSGPGDYALLGATLLLYMFCWEFFFRGFLLFGMAQGFGPVVAIGLQAALFGAAHWGKPPIETIGAFAGGVILGTICWREKSFVPAFYIHALVHIVWAVLVYV
jgi:membrane protease YdiL (CAAX protease family)